MSEENVELAKRLYPGTFDVVRLLAEPLDWAKQFEPLVHPHFETVGAALGMGSTGIETTPESTRRSAYGVPGFIEVWRNFLSAWTSWIVTAAEFIDVDQERVLVFLSIRARSRTHGVEIPIEAANLLTFLDGKLARLELLTTRSEALKAAGLQE